MADQSSEPGKRLLVVIEPGADIDKVESGLRAAGATVHEKLEFIGTLIVTGDPERISGAKLSGVRSIEQEGTVRTQD
jgi:hypothetical protein